MQLGIGRGKVDKDKVEVIKLQCEEEPITRCAGCGAIAGIFIKATKVVFGYAEELIICQHCLVQR